MDLSENPELLLACTLAALVALQYAPVGATTGYVRHDPEPESDSRSLAFKHGRTARLLFSVLLPQGNAMQCRYSSVFFSPATVGCELLLKTAACRPGACWASRSPQAKLARDVNAHSGVA
jgi:hypothetical protein